MDELNPEELASHRLISSRRVEGTPVFDPTGEKLGKVHSVMIDKLTGQVDYAVLEFGGLLKIDEHVHPLPWQMLTYDPERGGYIVNVSREELEKAPLMTLDSADRPHTPTEHERLYRYYGLAWAPWL